MGFFLTGQVTESEVEGRSTARRSRSPTPARLSARNPIGAPKRTGVLSTKYTDDETGLIKGRLSIDMVRKSVFLYKWLTRPAGLG